MNEAMRQRGRDVTGLVLAGGRGERLALGVPKALACLEGRSLLERAVDRLAAVCGDVRVVAPAALDLGAVPVPRVADAAGFAGPLAGLVGGLEDARGRACIVLGVDFPLIETAMLEWLREASRIGAPSVAPDAVVPRPGGIAQPLVAVYAASAVMRLREALERGARAMRDGIATLGVRWVDDAELAPLPGGLDSFLNVNEPADLERARRRLAARVETP
jgi:molybdopterin-guanine dinucleotide biosynthesis protein A